jgi:SAM-dependent methyltransferase
MPASEVGVNVEQTRAWDGPDGDNWTDHEDWYNEAARYLTPRLFAGAALKKTDRVLDIGCGCGETTRMAAREAQSGSVFGIDLSRRMIERARGRAVAEGLRNVQFERGDAQVYPFQRSGFNIVISRFGSMFFDDPVRAFVNIATALESRGRIALLCWRELRRNEWLIELREALAAGRDLPEPPQGAPSPFAFADPMRVRQVLTGAGFEDIALDPVEEPIYFGPNVERAFEGVTKQGIVTGLLSDLDDEARSQALDRVREKLAKHETLDGVLFDTSAWLVRAAKARER